MSINIDVVKDSQGRIDSILIKRKGKRPLTAKYLYVGYPDSFQLQVSGKTAPSDAELLRTVNQMFTERVAVLKEQPHQEELQWQMWIMDGNYVEAWGDVDRDGYLFRKQLYHGRMGAFFKDEVGKLYADWTRPLIAKNDNKSEPYPWQNCLRMRNENPNRVGVPTELYVGLPKAHQNVVMSFAAKLPSPAEKTDLYVGFEITSGGSWALLTASSCTEGVWTLRGVNYSALKTEGVELRHPDVYARYALVKNQTAKVLELWQAPVGDRYGFPLELTDTLDLSGIGGLPDVVGKTIPFFANEDANISEFRISRFWVYELP